MDAPVMQTVGVVLGPDPSPLGVVLPVALKIVGQRGDAGKKQKQDGSNQTQGACNVHVHLLSVVTRDKFPTVRVPVDSA